MLVGCVGCAIPGCDTKSSSQGGSQTTPDNPSSVLGKSAKMARDTKGSIQAMGEQQAAAAGQITGETATVEVNGVVLAFPLSWQKQQASGMRAAEFTVPSPDGNSTVVVFTGIGGTVRDNIERWKKQVESENGQPTDVKEGTRTVGGIKITTLQQDGVFRGMGPGGAPAAAQPGTRFLGAIIEAPRGQVQIRMTGPYDAVKAAMPAWEGLLNGIATK